MLRQEQNSTRGFETNKNLKITELDNKNFTFISGNNSPREQHMTF